MSIDKTQVIEEMIAKYFGWVKYDEPEDYQMTSFGGMWVDDDGKTGYDITKLAQSINQLISDITTEARYQELADLSYAIAKGNWYGDKQHKMFVYLANRYADLGADNAGNDLVAEHHNANLDVANPQVEVVTRYEAGKKPEVFMVNGKPVCKHTCACH